VGLFGADGLDGLTSIKCLSSVDWSFDLDDFFATVYERLSLDLSLDKIKTIHYLQPLDLH
jgi:hypothetical protein